MAISNKAKWWIIGSIITIGAGVGAYFLFRKTPEERQALKDEEDKVKGTTNDTDATPPISEAKAKSPSSNSIPRSYYDATGFTNNTEGNKFRKWVNCNQPDYAKEIDLWCESDATNGYDNSWMRKAFKKYGLDFQRGTGGFVPDSSKNVFTGFTPTFNNLMASFNKPLTYHSYNGVATGNVYFSLKFQNTTKSGYCQNWAYFFNHTPEYLAGTSNDARSYIDVRIKQMKLGNVGWEANGSVGKMYITKNADGTTNFEGFEGRAKGKTTSNSSQFGTVIGDMTDITKFQWC